MKQFKIQFKRAAQTFNPSNLLLLAGMLVAGNLSAQTMAQYLQTLPGQGSKVQIDGTSTIHDWKMESPIIAGTFEVDSKANFDKSKESLEGAGADGKIAAKATVRIPVRALKSYSPPMDEVYKKHMEETKHRMMIFELKELAVKKGDRKAGDPFALVGKGDMTIHGVKKSVELPVTIEPEGADKLKIDGKTALKMSDYEVQPPNPKIPGLGEIVTGDEIKLQFTWVVKKK